MPQLQLPLFPEGVTYITNQLAFSRQDGQVTYFNGHMPVFSHAETGIATFRMITSHSSPAMSSRAISSAPLGWRRLVSSGR